MPTNEEYRATIRNFQPEDLWTMWQSIRRRDEIDGWADGKALEYLILRSLEIEGVRVVWPYSVREAGRELEQIDGALYLDNAFMLLEAKDHGVRVDVEPIAKMRSQILRRPPGCMGVVFAVRGFTDPAAILTRYTAPQSVLLWNGDEFEFELQSGQVAEGLRIKYRMALELGVPDFDARVELTS